ncbi:MAG TPA: PQQ-binding-like beta-propeller repeat protein [Verrucomicrobiota bacterium]|nr:PQQ-binding-like beta-propeller repeat protein [Verrucomicrobiota bacterium]
MNHAPLLAACLTLSTAVSGLADWPAYRGPRGDGISTETGLARDWKGGAVTELWRLPASVGFSSFSVGGGKAFTLLQRTVEGAPKEVVVAFDAGTGRELWAAPLTVAKYDNGYDAGADDGPRVTPAYRAGRVYCTSALLRVACLEAATGRVVWEHDLMRAFGGRNITWQNAASPLVDEARVYVAGGGRGQSLLAFHKDTGAVVWKTGDERMTHATPVSATIHGVPQVIFFTQSGLVAVAPETGRELWRHRFRFNVSTAASPVVWQDIVYCSAGYGVGAAAVRISRSGDALKATELWRRTGNAHANHWSTPVAHEGHVYGMFSFKEYADGPLKCLDLATGEFKWERKGFGQGNVILVDGRLVALTDTGELVQLEATPAGYREITRRRVLRAKCWSTPAFSDGVVYVRDSKEGAAVRLAGR